MDVGLMIHVRVRVTHSLARAAETAAASKYRAQRSAATFGIRRPPSPMARRAAPPRGWVGRWRGGRVSVGPPGRAVAARAFGGAERALVERAAVLGAAAAGAAAPRPAYGCVLVDRGGAPVAEAAQGSQGSPRCEVAAAQRAGSAAEGGTAYVCLEPPHGEGAGEDAAVRALLSAGVSRVVVGLRNPLPPLRGRAVDALRAAGLSVDVLGDAYGGVAGEDAAEAARACRRANEALLHRVATRRPFSILKYAMTLDGKIATDAGHAAWISCEQSRRHVFELRAQSDAVIVGGNTVRRDNPRLTTRMEGRHQPYRVVLSRTLDLPQEANLWDVSAAPTLVFTQRGARTEFQEHLRSRGVEVVEFDFLSPAAAMDYCYARGFLQCFWECGGALAAPAVADGVIHKCAVFIAPKIIGGRKAPSPMGDLGFVQMTQALELSDVQFEQVAKDIMVTGYLPVSGGLAAVAAAASAVTLPPPPPAARPPPGPRELRFYKAWDLNGTLSNFAPLPVTLPLDGAEDDGPREWPTVEHYYQAHKFDVTTRQGIAHAEDVRSAPSPEQAAAIGRLAQRVKPGIVRADWDDSKVGVMRRGLQAKFTQHEAARQFLLATGDLALMEDTPHDLIWGIGWDGTGQNLLGQLLMEVRESLRAEEGARGSGNAMAASAAADE